MPTLAKSDSVLDSAVESSMKTSDANDTLYQFEASRDYDPGPDLELGILEREIKRIPKGQAIVLPLSPETRGHGTHTVATVWKQYLEELLASSSRSY